MAKLGCMIPEELERRLRVFVSWGKKGKLVEGLLRVAVERAERGDTNLIHEAIAKHWDAHK